MELRDNKRIQNKIFFYTNEENLHKKALLESFGVIVKYKDLSHIDLYDFTLNEILKQK